MRFLVMIIASMAYDVKTCEIFFLTCEGGRGILLGKGVVGVNDFNYHYNLRLRLANPNQAGAFTEHTAFFVGCVEAYNDAAKKARNIKKIDIVKVESKYIDICLYSNADLTKAPGRALMHLTTLLLNEERDGYDSYFTDHLYHNKLFSTEQISISKDYESLSDVEFVKRLIDYISRPKGEISEKDKSTMNRIKLIALENDLV